ncbi:DUF418 domain-containing protein [Qipengyuania aquimaris]|nr:DUF418 domain-containing protein [Qipengyuania aquimaris]
MSDAHSDTGPVPAEVKPVAEAGGRIASLDFIRGIAVMGILAANIIAMGQPFTAYMYPTAFTVDHSASEDWMWVAQFVLIDGKMRGLFTLLFGAGLYLFMEKAWAKGATRWLQARRLAWLGVFGLLHYYFIWRGDILLLYAVCGLIAVALFIGMSAKKQMVLGLLGYVAGGIFYAATMLFMQNIAEGDHGGSIALEQMQEQFNETRDKDLADGVAETRIRQDGSYADFVGHTFDKHAADQLSMLGFFALETLPLMLIGMALYRWGLFEGRMNRRKQRFWGWTGLIVGAAAFLVIALDTMKGGVTYYGALTAFVGTSHFPRLAMVLGLTALLALYAPRAGSWLGDRVSAAGRAAFTNYLGCSLVMLVVFGNWGLDLFGQLGRTELYGVVLVAWAVMLLWPKAWLDRFRYGPLEWLWRCLTYGKRFALRR